MKGALGLVVRREIIGERPQRGPAEGIVRAPLRCGREARDEALVRHTIEREGSKLIEKVSGGWPKVLSNLKSLLETGAAALVDPYPKAADAS